MKENDNKPFSDAIAMQIEEKVSELCDHAGIDYAERSLLERELFRQMEEQVIEFGKTMTDDAALKIALEAFGETEANAPFFRDPWYHRLLRYQRCGGARMFVILFAALFIERLWVATSYRVDLTGPFLWQILQYCYMRPSILGIITLMWVFLSKKMKPVESVLGRLLGITALSSFSIVVRGLFDITYLMMSGIASGEVYFIKTAALPIHIVSFVIGWALTLMAISCLLSEVLQWPEKAPHVEIAKAAIWKIAKERKKEA